MFRRFFTFMVISAISFSQLVGDSFTHEQLKLSFGQLPNEQAIFKKLIKLKEKGLSDDQSLDTLLE